MSHHRDVRQAAHRCLVSALVLLVISGGVRANSANTWQGAGTGGNTATSPADTTTQWTSSANWSDGVVPTSDNVLIPFANAGAAYAGTVSLANLTVNGASLVGEFRIGTGVTLGVSGEMRIADNELGYAVQTGGTVTVSDRFSVGYASGGEGKYDLSDGSLTSNYEHVAREGDATFTQTGGSHTVDTYLYIGGWYGPACTGTYSLSAGTLTTKDESVGHKKTGSFTQTGGVHTSTGMMFVGRWAGEGTYALENGTLNTNSLWVGHTATSALFTQTGGVHNCSNSLTIGSTGPGSYDLVGGELNTKTVGIGSSGGSGVFNHTGGTHTVSGEWATLSVGGWECDNGTYNLSGTGLLTGTGVTVGSYGTGRFVHTAGRNTCQSLKVGPNSNGSGIYELSGTGEMANHEINVGGTDGNGTFRQSGGTVDGFWVRVGYAWHSTLGEGRYELSGGELRLTATDDKPWGGCLRIATENKGTFVQTGGSSRIRSLEMGMEPTGDALYELQDGTLEASREYVSKGGAALFRQSGGTNTTNYLVIGDNGEYEYSGGTLNAGSIEIDGDFGFDCTTTTLSMSSGILDVSYGDFIQAQNASLILGSSACLIIRSGYDPSTIFDNYVNDGMTHVNGDAMAIDEGETLSGSGTIGTTTLENSGSLKPGSSPGALTIDGNFEQTDTGTLFFEFGGLLTGVDFDNVHVTGTATLEGTIDASLIDGYMPDDNMTFDVLLADGGITIGAGGLDLVGHPGSTVGFVGWSLTDGDTVLQLEYVIPEPGTLVLVLTAAASVVRCARRRRMRR